jgi:hypothetical protein
MMPRSKYQYNEQETQILSKLVRKNATLADGVGKLAKEVEYHFRHNYVIAVVPTKEKGILVGVAKRNPQDKFSVEAGKNIAFKRAVLADGGYGRA